MKTQLPSVAASSSSERDPTLPPGGASAGQPWPIDHTRSQRFVRPRRPADLARILNEAGYDEPTTPPSRLEQIIAVGAIWLALGTVGYFAAQMIRGVL